MKQWWRTTRPWIGSVAAVLVVIAVVFAPNVANAQVGDFAGAALGGVMVVIANIILELANFLGKAIALFLSVLQAVLQYNEFINHPVVIKGWEITRDLVNTGFVVLMLIIAFGTMFGVSKVDWQKNIPKLFIAAIAVNFSRLITGLFIDIGQVVMISFVNALQQVGFANFIDLFKLRESQALSGGQAVVDGSFTLAAAAFAFVTVLITLIVIGVIVAVLVYRIVILWVLIIMSPIAFIAGAAKDILSPAGNIYSDWWSKLTAAIMIGPVLTFFLWLALSSVSSGLTITGPATGGSESFLGTALGSTEQFTGFIIAIALMMAGLEIGMQSAKQIGGFAEKAVGAGQGLAKRAAAAPAQLAVAGGMRLGRKGLGKAVDVVKRDAGFRLDQFRNYREENGGADARDDREAAARARVQAGGYGAIKGRKDLAAIQKEKDAIAARQKDAAGAAGGLEEGRSTESALSEIDSLDGNMSSTDIARAGNLARDIVGDEERFADLRRTDPTRAAKLLKQAQKHTKNIGDEAGTKKIDDMLARNMSWSGDSAEDMAAKLANMSDADKKKLSAGNWENADFRKAAQQSGFMDELRDQERNKGYSGAARKAAERAHGTQGADDAEYTRYNAEKDAIEAARRGGTDKDELDRRTKSNDGQNRLQNALSSGTLGDLMKSGGLKLQDIDMSSMDPQGLADMQKALASVVTDSNGGSTLQALKDAASADNENVSEQARANAMMNLMGDASFGARVDQRLNDPANPGNRDASRRNNTILSGDTRTYGFDSASASFGGNESGRREFKAAVASDPSIVLNIDQAIEAGDGNGEAMQAVADIADKDMMKGLMEKLERSRGTDMEDMNKRVIDKMGEMLERRAAQLKGSGSGDDAIRKQVDAALKHYNRRMKGQV